MKQRHFLFVLLDTLMILFAFTACSRNDDDNKSKKYQISLNYNADLSWQAKYYEWDAESYNNGTIYLFFDEGIPKGADWILECDQPWVQISNKRGRVSDRVDMIPFTVKNNEDYDERKAHIYLNVPEGIPESSWSTSVTIIQNGYSHYLGSGGKITVKINGSKAKSSRLTIENIYVDEIVEINWGDGTSDVLNNMDRLHYTGSGHTISHTYSANDTYNVIFRFARNYRNNGMYFRCNILKGQGVEMVTCGYDEISVNSDAQNVSIALSDNFGFTVKKY